MPTPLPRACDLRLAIDNTNPLLKVPEGNRVRYACASPQKHAHAKGVGMAPKRSTSPKHAERRAGRRQSPDAADTRLTVKLACNKRAHFAGADCQPASRNVARAMSAAEYTFDGGLHRQSFSLQAQGMPQQHGGCQNRTQGICHPTPRNIGSGAMNRLVQAGA